MNSWKVWLHGLAAAAISGFATSLTGALALPTVFSFDRNGFINMVKMAIPPAILSVALYLKSSPVPALTLTGQTSTETPEGTVTSKSTLTVTKND
jgi:hypothetical protein